MGIAGAGAFFQHVIELEVALAYLDDVIAVAHLQNFTAENRAYFGPISKSQAQDPPRQITFWRESR